MGGNRRYVSTGHLPSARQVQAAVDEAYRLYRTEASGETSQTYSALARVPGHLFGICVAGVRGSVYRAGDSQHEFTIMSVAKPFVGGLAFRRRGAWQERNRGRNHRSLAGQGRPGGILAAPRLGGQQYPGSIGGPASVHDARPEPVRVHGAHRLLPAFSAGSRQAHR
jgi:glutaminase